MKMMVEITKCRNLKVLTYHADNEFFIFTFLVQSGSLEYGREGLSSRLFFFSFLDQLC